MIVRLLSSSPHPCELFTDRRHDFYEDIDLWWVIFCGGTREDVEGAYKEVDR